MDRVQDGVCNLAGSDLSLMQVAVSSLSMSTVKYWIVGFPAFLRDGIPASGAPECLALKRAAVGDSLSLAGAMGAACATAARAMRARTMIPVLRDMLPICGSTRQRCEAGLICLARFVLLATPRAGGSKPAGESWLPATHLEVLEPDSVV